MRRRPKLLIEEPPLQVLPSLAVRIGLNEAIVLQQLHYLTLREKGAPLDLKQAEWRAEHFPFWSTVTVKRTFRRLRELNLLVTEQPHGSDRRNRCRIDYEALSELEQSDPLEGIKLTPSTGSDRPVPGGQIDPLHIEEKNSRTAERQEDEANASSSDGGHEADASSPPRRTTGTTEPTPLTSPAAPKDKPDVDERNANPEFARLAELLADLIEGHGTRRPTDEQIESWRNDVRLMVERDGRTLEQIEKAMRWAHNSTFWRANVLSMGKLRTQFDQLRLQSQRDRGRQPVEQRRPTSRGMDGWRTWVSEHFPDLGETAHHQAVFIAQTLDGGGHEVTVDRVRARLLDRQAA